MRVKAVASTVVDYEALREMGYIPHWELVPEPADDAPEEEWDAWLMEYIDVDPIDELHEAAGRRCYNSWHRPNEKTATNKGYLGNIIEVQHESVLGHGHVTLSVEGVTRALLLELERHQEHMNINFSVVSQRYVDHSEAEFVVPPLLEKHLDEPLHDPPTELPWSVGDELRAANLNAQESYKFLAEFMESKGYKRKEIRGAVRAVLPEATETKFLVTGSIRAWRDIIRKRLTEGADIEIRLFAIEVLKELIRLCPNSVQDFAELHAAEIGENK